MKNLLLLLLALPLMVACSPQAPTQTGETQYGDFKIKIIDGCEYIEFDHGIVDQRVYSLTHKGNCKSHK